MLSGGNQIEDDDGDVEAPKHAAQKLPRRRHASGIVHGLSVCECAGLCAMCGVRRGLLKEIEEFGERAGGDKPALLASSLLPPATHFRAR